MQPVPASTRQRSPGLPYSQTDSLFIPSYFPACAWGLDKNLFNGRNEGDPNILFIASIGRSATPVMRRITHHRSTLPP
jgi:hypothetical protein